MVCQRAGPACMHAHAPVGGRSGETCMHRTRVQTSVWIPPEDTLLTQRERSRIMHWRSFQLRVFRRRDGFEIKSFAAGAVEAEPESSPMTLRRKPSLRYACQGHVITEAPLTTSRNARAQFRIHFIFHRANRTGYGWIGSAVASFGPATNK